jgi:hypothetical protein
MIVSSCWTPCEHAFQRSELSTLSPQYIPSLVRFLPQNLVLYTLISAIRGFNAINKLQLHKRSATISVHCDSIKIFKKMPNYVTESVLRKRCFISNVKKYLIDKHFYWIEEFVNSLYDICYEIWLGFLNF